MSLDRTLYYYSNGDWQNINNYVIGISKFEYGIGSIDKGTVAKLKVTLDSNCPYYGTANQWKLVVGSDYILLGAPKDGIEAVGGFRLEVTLIDYFFVAMYQKAPLKIAGEGDVTSLAGEAFTVKTINDLLVEYSTDQANLDIDGFSSRDDINYYDGLGNTITVTDGKAAIRYKTEGALRGLSQIADLGQAYVSIRDVLNNIAVAEGFTLDVDFGVEEANSYGTIDISTLSRKKTWDAKVINGVIIALSSGTATINLDSFDTDNNIVDNLSWVSRDWAEDANGIDFIAYQIFPDYRKNCCYIPGWYCASYVHDDLTNTYIFRILKVSVASDGTLTQDYDAQDTGGSDFWNWSMEPAQRANLQARDYRFSSTLSSITGWDNLTWYTDEDLAGESKFRIILRKGSGSTDMHVIDPDLWQASSANSIYTYTLGAQSGWIVPDWMNGTVVHIYHNGSAYVKDFYRVSMSILTAGYTVSGNGGIIHMDDDPKNNTLPPIGVWRESIIYTNTIPDATNPFFYHLPQVPNGHLVREGVYNNYIEKKTDYLSLNYGHDYSWGGSAWDDSIDRAFVWSNFTSPDPQDLRWDIADNYTYKRMYLYQPYIYEDRTEQFLDALVSHGFFYEQRNGNVRLLRMNGSGTNIGIFTDSNLLNKVAIDGFTDFAQQYVLQVLNSQETKESGDQSKNIATTISKLGWFSMWQMAFYSDWTYQINSDLSGIEMIADIERFNDVASTRYPLLGDKFTYYPESSNVYACAGGISDTGDIYMQTDGKGDFVALGQTSRHWEGMTSANGNVYASVYGGDIYIQTRGVGDFIALSQTSRNWMGMTSMNGNVYACVYPGDIYMQTGGIGDFVALGQTSRYWQCMTTTPNGNIYATVWSGDIYMQTAGTGDFVALNQTSRNWFGMAAASNGNVYAAVWSGDIYMQTAGTGDFVALSQTSRYWRGMAFANGNIYAPVYEGSIYMQTAGTGNFATLNQASRYWIGMTAINSTNYVIIKAIEDIENWIINLIGIKENL